MADERSEQLEDQRSDLSRRELINIARRLADPALARTLWKTAMSEEPVEESATGAAAYAWPEQRKLPLGSDRDVLLSRAYFEGQRDRLDPQTAGRIEARLAAHEVLRGGSPRLIFKERRKTAAVEAWELLPGVRVAAEGELRKAGEDFEARHARLTFSDRVAFACEFAKCARAMGDAPLPNAIRVYAGLGRASSLEDVRKHLLWRKAAALRGGRSGEDYEKLARALDAADDEELSRQDLRALAAAIHILDDEHGFTRGRNSRRLPDACRVVFTGEEDAAPPVETPAPQHRPSDGQALAARFGVGVLEQVEGPGGDPDPARVAEVMRLFGGDPVDGTATEDGHAGM